MARTTSPKEGNRQTLSWAYRQKLWCGHCKKQGHLEAQCYIKAAVVKAIAEVKTQAAAVAGKPAPSGQLALTDGSAAASVHDLLFQFLLANSRERQ